MIQEHVCLVVLLIANCAPTPTFATNAELTSVSLLTSPHALVATSLIAKAVALQQKHAQNVKQDTA